MRINHSVLALQRAEKTSIPSHRLERSFEDLNAGWRNHRSNDGMAGVAIDTRLRSQARALSRALLMAQDGVSTIRSGEAALDDVQALLQRMRAVAVQSLSEPLSGNERLELQKEVTRLRDDLDRVSCTAEFNAKRLLNGTQTVLISVSSPLARAYVTGSCEVTEGDFTATLTLLESGASHLVRSQAFTIDSAGSFLPAAGETTLQSIVQFRDKDGTSFFARPRTLAIQGNGRQVSLLLDGGMTLIALSSSIQEVLTSSTGLDLRASKALVMERGSGSSSERNCCIQISSGKIGAEGRLAFAADFPLLAGFSLSTVREPVNDRFRIELVDAEKVIRTVITDTNRVNGLLKGVDLVLAARDEESAQATSSGSCEAVFRLHLIDRSLRYRIGVEPAEDLKIDFCDMTADALGISRLDLMSGKAAKESLGRLDAATDRVSAEQSRLGGFRGRLDRAITHLRSTGSNLTAAASGSGPATPQRKARSKAILRLIS